MQCEDLIFQLNREPQYYILTVVFEKTKLVFTLCLWQCEDLIFQLNRGPQYILIVVFEKTKLVFTLVHSNAKT